MKMHCCLSLAVLVAAVLSVTQTASATALSDRITIPSIGVDMTIAEGTENPVIFFPTAGGIAPQWVGFSEPGSTTLSDIVFIDPGGDFNFVSDTNDVLPALPPFLPQAPNIIIEETGSPQDISGLFFGFPGPLPQMFITSDIETPEPASIALLSAGACVLLRRRRNV